MMNKNSEISVTSVTYSPLLQRMRKNRRNLPPKKETPLLPIEESAKCKLPPLILDWISVCLKEGHIQPSQPSVGRLEGWPMRPYFKNSLYVDFECWCLKAKIPTYLIPSKELFCQGTDAIFDSIECGIDLGSSDPLSFSGA